MWSICFSRIGSRLPLITGRLETYTKHEVKQLIWLPIFMKEHPGARWSFPAMEMCNQLLS
jgi:hypothetical protein